MRSKTLKRCLWLLAVTMLVIVSAMAQTETGQITGTVMDPTGAVVPNAKVTVRNTDTGALRNLTTNAAGVYAAPNLPPGNYQVTVEDRGFMNAQRMISVNVGAKVGLDITLQVGQTGTTVEVSEAAATINTETQTLGATISTREVIELPTLTRDPYQLVGTVGNVSPADPSARGVGYAINGQRSAATNVLLDGVANNDEFTASRGQQVPLDSVQEFSVLTSDFTAEYGRASAGVVNVATKSGTNSFHGSAYEFNRVSALASNDFDNNANGIDKPVFTRNQFGYSVGGPIVKNKLFFFNNTEWIRVRSQGVSTVWVPTQQFIGLSTPATQSFFNSYGKLRPNLVSLGSFSKANFQARGFDLCKGLAASSACAAVASNVPLFQRVSYAFPTDSGGGDPQNTYMTVGRVDYNLSDRTQMYVRYALYNESDFSGTVSNSPYAGYDSPNTQVNNSVIFSLTRSISPSFVSQSKVDFNRFNNQQPFGTGAAGPTLYLGSASVATSILGNNVALPGYDPYTPGNAIPFGGPQNFVQLYQDMSKIAGKHNIRFGGTVTYLRDNRTFGAYETAVEVLGTSAGTNVPRGVEGFLTGNLYQFQAAVYPQGKFPCGATVTADCTLTLPVGQPNFSRSNRYWDWGLYLQDSWKITPRLTFNYGVRWDVYGTQHNKDPKLDSNFYLGSGSNYFQQIASGSVQLAPNSPIGKLWNTDYHNFGPRIGAAWDVFGDGKTSLRGGYGRYFERNFGNVTFNVIQNPPNYAVLSLFAGQDLPSIAVTPSNAGPLAGSGGTKALPKVSLRAVNPDIKTAYVDAWSAALEHKFGENLTAALEYSGSHGGNQYGIANVNRAGGGNYYLGVPCTPGVDGDAGTCTARLRATQFSNINFRTTGGFSDYHAMIARMNWRGRNTILGANYTWSHAIDTLSDTFSSSSNQNNLGWLDPFHPSLDKGDAYYDLRHRVNVFGVLQVPYGSGSNFRRYVLGGWEFAPNFTAYTGAPYTLYDCTNAITGICPYSMFTGAAPKTPNTALKATATPNKYVYYTPANLLTNWFNPKMGTSDWGPFPSAMIGRNFFRAPGQWNVDFAIHKNIPVGEGKRLQLRGEAFNVFNHPNLVANTGDNDVSSIDYVSASYSGRRNLQLALRFDF